MKIKLLRKKQATGFTLIEMIGVLAVIAILAALLIPKIFEAINNARVNNACITLGTVKTAIADHYAKYGSLAYDGVTKTVIPVVAGTPATAFDKVLLKEAFLDKMFAVKISDNVANTVQLSAAEADTVDCDGVKAAYNLDGDVAATAKNDATGSVVVEAIIKGVTINDAIELSKRLDGDALSDANPANADIKGRVIYAAPTTGTTDVHVYLTHR